MKNKTKTIKTSGTSSGTQKGVNINVFERFEKTKVIKKDLKYSSLGTLYSKESWANLSTSLFCNKNDIKHIQLKSIVEIFKKEIDILCLTPSQLRQISFLNKKNYSVKQLTLGGEYSTQEIIDLSLIIFPNARVTHVYSSTETGDICSVSDQKEGYPFEKFSSFIVTETSITIDDIKLNDIWCLVDDRYYFSGRSDCIVNVAGKKVNIEEVERKVIGLKICKDCNVFSRKSKITDNILVMDYVGETEKKDMKKILSFHLEKHEIPMLKKVESIKLNVNGKKNRVKK